MPIAISRPYRWPLLAFACFALANALVVLSLSLHSGGLRGSTVATSPGQALRLADPISNDSWGPMATAAQRYREAPDGNLYRVFFDEAVKFQYPPTALLVLELLPRSLIAGPESFDDDTPLNRLMTALSWLALAATLIFSMLIFKHSVVRGNGDHAPRRFDTLALIAGAILLGLTFYPLIRGHILGQIQIFLGALTALALFAYLTGRRGVAGACLGLCCLIKPQYAVVFIWALVRRDWRFAAWFAGVGAFGLMLSLARFGFDNHLHYLDVLRYISWHGEAYWPNQSINGILNRFLQNGEAIRFEHHAFAPHHPFVYYATLLSSAAVILLALSRLGAAGRRSDAALDLAAVLVAAKIAAPVAWEHHYGAFIAIYALAVPAMMRIKPFGRATAPLLIASYVMTASVVLRPQLLFANPWVGLAGSHIFYGALLLFIALLLARFGTSQERATSHTPAQISAMPATRVSANDSPNA